MFDIPTDTFIHEIERMSFPEVEKVAGKIPQELEDLGEKRRYLYGILKQHKLFDVFKDLIVCGQFTLYHHLKYKVLTLGENERICMAVINRVINVSLCKPLFEYIIASLQEKEIIELVTKFAINNRYGKYILNSLSLDWEPKNQTGIEDVLRFDKILTKQNEKTQ
jgi:hypothetical protein